MSTLRRYRRVLLGFIGMALAAGAVAGLYLLGAFGGPDMRAVLPRAPRINPVPYARRPRRISPGDLRARVLIPNVTVAFTDSRPDAPVALYVARPGARRATLLAPRKRMLGLDDVIADLAFSRNGRCVAFTAHANTGRGDEPRTLCVLDLTRRTAKALSAPKWDAVPACWLPDGRLLAAVKHAGHREKLCLYNPNSGAARFLPHPDDDDLSAWNVSADARSILYLTRSYAKTHVMRQPIDGAKAKEVAVLSAPPPPNAFNCMVVSSRGDMAFSNGMQSLITDAAGHPLVQHAAALSGMLWSPDGRYLIGIESKADIFQNGIHLNGYGSEWIEVFDRKALRFDKALKNTYGVGWGHMEVLGWLPGGRDLVLRGYVAGSDTLSLWRLGSPDPIGVLLDRPVLDVDWWPKGSG